MFFIGLAVKVKGYILGIQKKLNSKAIMRNYLSIQVYLRSDFYIANKWTCKQIPHKK